MPAASGPAPRPQRRVDSSGSRDGTVHRGRPGHPFPADLNLDGTVEGADLGLLLTSLGDWTPVNLRPPDLNGDKIVDGADFGILLGAWGPQ